MSKERRDSRVVHDGRYQFVVAVALTAVIPVLAVSYLLVVARAGHADRVQTYIISGSIAALAVTGYGILLKYPLTVFRVRQTLRRIVEGDLPEAVTLRTADLEIRNIEEAINLIVQRLKKRIEVIQREKGVMEQELFQSQKLEAMGVMAAGIAHEINTPAQFIGDNARFLAKASRQSVRWMIDVKREIETAKGTGDTEALERAFRLMTEGVDFDAMDRDIANAANDTQEGIERIKDIVQAVRDFAQVTTEGARVPLDLNRVVKSTLAVSRNEWKCLAELEVELDPGLPLVPCVWGDINQVLLNLMVNAVQAVAARGAQPGSPLGKIRVTTHVEDDMAVVTISDNGVGMSDESARRAFDLFFSTKKNGRGGMGIGLPIAHFLVTRRHGGSLTFETEQGKGTTFRVRLPLVVPGIETEEDEAKA